MDWKGFIGSRIFRFASGAALFASVYLAQPYRPAVIVGNSMAPTYRNNEVALATTNIGRLKKGDVVIIEGPYGTMVKRVAFAPGDWMELRYFVHRWRPAIAYQFDRMKNLSKVPISYTRIPDDYVFLLGDNPVTSVDSRTLGVMPVSAIRAKLVNERPYDESVELSPKDL